MGSSEQEYDEKTERRQDNTSVRLALLESRFVDLKESQISIHKRITDFKSEIKEDMRVGFRDLKADLENFINKGEEKCITCSVGLKRDIGILKEWRAWITGGYVTLAAAFLFWVKSRGRL